MNKTTEEEYRSASKGLKFVSLLDKCACGEQVNITNEWVAIEPIPEGKLGIEADRTMISRCKKCGELFLTEFNFAKSRWSIFGSQHFYLCDIDEQMREQIIGKKRE
jgi:hypothetical protein